MFVSDVFKNRTGHNFVYNITAIENISSIIKNGILCYDAAKKVSHRSIAMDEVQKRRERVVIPNGLRLHRYANLYFDYNNPMMYRRKDIAEEICVLAIDAAILNDPNCIVSDRNAAADLVKFYRAANGIDKINFGKVFSQYWNNDNLYEMYNHRSIKCAEILIPHCVPYHYITEAYVVNHSAAEALFSAGFRKKIAVSPKVFYRKEGVPSDR